jgi:FKBP-type peptidyl-prolyl cis-trans isomerase FklB
MNTHMEKVSYIIGRQIGGDFATQGIDVNMDMFLNGFKSAIAKEEALLNPAETQEIMQAFQVEMAAKAQELATEAGGKNLEVGAKYLELNKQKEGVLSTASGLQYRVEKSGEGATPTAESTVEVHYEGTLIDGTVFDSSFQRGQTTSFPVGGVIPGWTEALQLMKEGDVWHLTIPSELAYGERGAGGQIGPHSVLNFKVELIKVVS